MTTILPETYTLLPSDLLNKWGFADGELLFDVTDWLNVEENLIVNGTDLLLAVVHRFLLPAVGASASNVEELLTSHNPIRLNLSIRTMPAQVRAQRAAPVIVKTADILALARTLSDKPAATLS